VNKGKDEKIWLEENLTWEERRLIRQRAIKKEAKGKRVKVGREGI